MGFALALDGARNERALAAVMYTVVYTVETTNNEMTRVYELYTVSYTHSVRQVDRVDREKRGDACVVDFKC